MRFLFVCLAMLPLKLFATETMPTVTTTTIAPPKASLVRTNGEIQIHFTDGNKAHFRSGLGKVQQIALPMRQIENTCNYTQKLATCSMKLDIATYHASLNWIQHSTADKVGKVVVYKFKGSTSPPTSVYSDNGIFSWYVSRAVQHYETQFNPDRIVCDQLDWTAEMPIQNSVLQVHSWSAEAMSSNSETNANENMGFTQAHDVRMKKINNTTLEFVQGGTSSFKFPNFFTPYVSAQVINLNFVSTQGNQCQVAFEMNLNDALKMLQDAEFRKVDPNAFTAVPDHLPANVALPIDLMFKVRPLLAPGDYLEVQ